MSIHAFSQAVRQRLSLVSLPEDLDSESFAEAVRAGLSANPKTLPCKYFYDRAGSQLFEAICELPEYYPTRTEDEILREHALAMLSGWEDSPVLIELGSGSSSKTRRLIGSAFELHGEAHYVPIDVSPSILRSSSRSLVQDFPRLRVTGYVGDYRGALVQIARQIHRPKCFIFLGSSIGNYEEDAAIDLLRCVAHAMAPRDRFLLGTDLVKDRAILEAAYDDAQGVTAAFNRNILVRINSELSADFHLEAFDHKAIYRQDFERVEMHLVSRQSQIVRIRGAGLKIEFSPGESIHTENSHKYTSESLTKIARQAGFVEEANWSDPNEWFRLQRWRLA